MSVHTEPPTISVVLPCFNAESSLPQALESLRRQTYTDIEILALDDGSTDGTASILRRFADADVRVRVFRSERNRGLIPTLNRGVQEARGHFIARLDADDVAFPGRFQRQLDALTRCPEVAVLGSGTEVVADDGRPCRPRPVRCLGPGGARFMALLGTPVAHPTVMARADVMKNHPYGGPPESLHTEDYELFTRMLAAGVGFGNVDEPLVMVRVQSSGVSMTNEQLQIANFVTCARAYLEATWGLRPPSGAHRVLVNRLDETITPSDLEEGFLLLDKLERTSIQREPDAQEDIRRTADLQRVDILVQASRRGSRALRVAAVKSGLRQGRRLLNPHARRYLSSKFVFARRRASVGNANTNETWSSPSELQHRSA
jgi:glycosyltransferase involved in cell wall biosynthesis